MDKSERFAICAGIGKQNRTLEEDIELRTMETNAVGFARMVGTAFRYFADGKSICG